MASDLRNIEGNVFRMMNMDDGLMDVFLGIMLIPYTIWIYNPDFPIPSYILPFVAYALVYPIFMLLKKYSVRTEVDLA